MIAVRTLVRGVGQLFITLGLVILLFCVYELFWTGVATREAQGSLRDQLQHGWNNDPKANGGEAEPFDIGSGIGIVRIPRLGDDFSWVIVEGVTTDALKKGPGHYPDTAMPGEVGNFAVAAHRATNGEPFAHLDQVAPGDDVLIETRDATYTYRVETSEITTPSDVDVIAPVPNEPGVKPTQKRITLTTCHPRWSSTHRLIVYGILDSVEKKPGATRAAAESGAAQAARDSTAAPAAGE